MTTYSEEDRSFWSGFIDMYRDNPTLWKLKSKDYSDREKKNCAYEVLVEKLKERDVNATKDTVKKKINNLRSAFRKELKKVARSKKSGAGTDKIYTPTLWYYNDLLFLKDHQVPRLTSSDTFEGDASTSVKSLLPTQARKRVKTEQQEELLGMACKRLHNTDNEYAIVASGWAVDLQKMSPTQMLFAKKAINDILFEGQMGTLHRHSVVINEPYSKVSTPMIDYSDQSSNQGGDR
ncbi:hypothetical protein Pcinc_031336 [Petrolisthes cinctipes]|uniref:MADF domain-containing protein n=1 Tax=Petrolisthes cinctipes TaxID=88211 RepID=A0AAE1EXD0_PETCI|nr:hypothetical protein Pcinc_031336 [Petrolisthes cinctipes]